MEALFTPQGGVIVRERPRRSGYVGSAETIGIEPGPGFVPPVMALDSLPVEPHVKPVTLVAFIGDRDNLVIADADEEEIADAMDFYYKNWRPDMWPMYILMEVST